MENFKVYVCTMCSNLTWNTLVKFDSHVIFNDFLHTGHNVAMQQCFKKAFILLKMFLYKLPK